MSAPRSPSRAPSWHDQPMTPPISPARRLITPAARAALRRAPHVETPPPTADGAPLRRAEAEAWVQHPTRIPREESSEPVAAPSRPDHWHAVDVVVGTREPSWLLAAAARYGAAALRTGARNAVVTAVHVPDHTGLKWTPVVFEQIGSFDITAIARRIDAARAEPAAAPAAPGTAVEFALYDGTGLGVDRFQPGPTAPVTAGLGAIRPGVVATPDLGATAIRVAEVAEVWVQAATQPPRAVTALVDALRTALERTPS